MCCEHGARISAAVVTVLILVAVDNSSHSVTKASVQPRRDSLIVDFRALDRGGDPVADLKPADLILRVRGRERTVSSLQLISRSDSGAAPVTAPPFATNSAALSERRDLSVLIDEASIAPGKEHLFRDALSSLLSRISPRDRVRLMSLRPVGPVLPFEDGLRDATNALARFTGHSTATETADDLVCRSQTGLDRLQSLFVNYSGSPVPRSSSSAARSEARPLAA